MRLYTAATRLLILILVPIVASALGLGDISLNSALNEPFSAEIPLESVQQADLEELTVELASADTFDRYGLDRPAFLSGIKFAVTENKNGQPVIRLSSSVPVAEPFVTMLLDVRWSSGRLLREYTVLLDPPLFEANVVQAPATPAQSSVTSSSPAQGQVARTVEPAAAEVIEPTGLFQTPSETSADSQAVIDLEPVPELEIVPEEEPVVDVMVEAEPEPVVEPETQPEPVQAAPAYAAPVRSTPFDEVSAAAAVPDSYTTQRGDTLWGISERVRSASGLSNNQMMLALYRANPDAFMGNINRLKAGAILRIPAEAELAAPGQAEATAEVIEQNAAWSASRGQESRLQLVAPTGTDDSSTAVDADIAVDSGTGDEAAESASTEGALDDQAADSERLLQVEDAEMQALQQRVNEQEQIAADAAATEAQIFADTEAALETDEITDEIAESEEEVVAPAPGSVGASTADEGSFLGGIFSSLWFWGAVALALLVAFVLARARKTEPDAVDAAATGSDWATDIDEPSHDETVKDFGDDFGAADSMAADEDDGSAMFADDPDATHAGSEFGVGGLDDAEGAPLDDPFAESFAEPAGDTLGDDLDFRVDADDIFAAPESGNDDIPQQEAGQDEVELPLEKTISTGAPLNLDQADPIAEAEFHMAYGLYDQAADLLVHALEETPDNRLYRVKLLEVFFVWENKDGFLEQARALRSSIADDSDSDWNKVLILGKQLCPDDDLFSGADAALSSAGSMDLELSDVGETEIDFTLGGGEVQALDLDVGFGDESDSGNDGGVDFDFGDDIGDADEGDELTLNIGDDDNSPAVDTVALDSQDIDLDFGAGENDSESTMESPTIENPMVGSGHELSDTDATVESDFLRDSPTMESPTIESPMVASESELADTDATMESDTIESSMEGETLESPTLDTLGASAETTQMPGLEDPTSLEIDLSGLTDLPVDSDDLVDLETSVRTDEGDTDFGLDEGEAAGDTVAQPLVDAAIGDTAEQPILDDLTDTGVADDSQETSPVEDEAWSLPEDATMTEVGTKLDLARAYIDMGDPDGARSILNEVLDEGEDSQRQEARQLLAELDD